MKLIAIPGWGTNSDTWRPLQEHLRGEFSLTTISWQDCLTGKDPLLPCGDDPVLILGWSLGGSIALKIANSNPERIVGLVVVSASLRFCGSENFPGTSPRVLKAMQMRLRRQREETLRDFAALLSPRNGFFEDSFLPMTADIDTDTLSDGLGFLADTDLTEVRPSIPTVVLHGENDRVIPVSAGDFLAHRLGGEFRCQRGLEHDLPWSAPEEIAAACRDLQRKAKHES